MSNTLTALLAVVLVLGLSTAALAQAPLRILYLTKSSGFEHSAVKREGDELAYSEKVIKAIAEKMGATITITKDASLINAENLKNYDVVIFYTSGDLTEEGTDKQPAMSKTGVEELTAWVNAGGGFMGFHAGNDSFRAPGDTVSPYIKLIGGEFAGHGKQFSGTIRLADPTHPTVKHFPDGWTHDEEWYTFIKLNTADMHVIALLDPGAEREKQEMYDVPAYPFIWCRAQGQGRVYYNGLGHREDVWDNADVQNSIADAILWASGAGPLQADPNYDTVVKKEMPAGAGAK